MGARPAPRRHLETLMPNSPPATFKTPAGQARYYAAYAATLALWPVPVESVDVPTPPWGRTHLNVAGPVGAPPLLLLPGAAVSATMWYPNIGALSQAHRVYAADLLGDLGQSVSAQRLAQPADYGRWLVALLDALPLETVAVAGLSLGGFAALQLALAAPERVRRLVLMAPAGFVPIRWQFFARMATVFTPGFLMSAATKQRVLLGVYSPTVAPLITQLFTPNDFKYSAYLPPLVSDRDLRRVSPPTLMLWGDHEVVYPVAKAERRATRLLPHLRTATIPGAGHTLNLDQPELVNQALLDFLAAPA